MYACMDSLGVPLTGVTLIGVYLILIKEAGLPLSRCIKTFIHIHHKQSSTHLHSRKVRQIGILDLVGCAPATFEACRVGTRRDSLRRRQTKVYGGDRP